MFGSCFRTLAVILVSDLFIFKFFLGVNRISIVHFPTVHDIESFVNVMDKVSFF